MLRISTTLALASLLFSTATHAVIRSWPSAQCASTLQACIESSVAGDTVRVVQLAEVDESLTITQNIDLVGSPRLTLAAGQGIDIRLNTVAADGDSVAVIGVRMKRGRILARQTGTGTITRRVLIRDVTVDQIEPLGAQYFVFAAQEGTAPFSFTLSRIFMDLDASSFTNVLGSGVVTASKFGGTATGRLELFVTDSVFRFRGAPSGSDIRMIRLASDEGDSAMRVTSSTVSGGRIGIFSQNSNGGNHSYDVSHSTFDQQQSAIVMTTSAAATVTSRVTNNTITRYSQFGLLQSSNINSTLSNNIFANGNCALGGGGSVSATRNLVFANTDASALCQLVGTTGLRTVDPRFVNLTGGDTRLRPDSPARNDGASLTGLSFDADGQARNLDAAVDLGAYETNEEVLAVAPSASNITSNFVTLPSSLFAVPPTASGRLFAAAATVSSPPLWPTQGNLGVFFQDNPPNSQWNVFDQSTASPIFTNGRFHISSVTGNNTILARANSLAGNFFLIDDPRINSNPDARLIVTPNWNPFGTSIYDNHAIAVRYDNPNNKWAIYHPDGTLPPFNAYYNVLIASSHLTQGVFQSLSTQAPLAVFGARINMPLLNDNPCAAPFITRVPSGLGDAATPVLLQYVQETNGGYWYAVNAFEASNPIAVNVYFNAAQAKRCLLNTWEGFGNGFE